MNKISRKGFLKIAAAAAMSGVTAGALAACNAASGSTSTAASGSAAASGATGTYIPGTYEGTAEGISSTVKVTMTFSDSAVTDVVVDTSGETASIGAAAADELRDQLLAAGSAEIDGVSGSTITSEAVMKAAKSCYAQAKGEAVVSSVQLPTGDENDWLGTEPDIDEAAITETVDTDILIVGAGNGGMFAAAYAAANGLNFRIIEQNGNVQDTRHWYGAIDSAAAKAAGEEPFDRAKLLSEISRYASGKCDQRVVRTWINESAAMHDFMRSILEDKYGWECDFTSGSEAAWPAENAEHNTDYLFPVEEHNYMASENQSGKPRNELLLDYIQRAGLRCGLQGQPGQAGERRLRPHHRRHRSEHGRRPLHPLQRSQGRSAGLRRLRRQPVHDGAAGSSGHQRHHCLLLLPRHQGLRHPRCCVGRCQPGQGIRSHAV